MNSTITLTAVELAIVSVCAFIFFSRPSVYIRETTKKIRLYYIVVVLYYTSLLVFFIEEYIVLKIDVAVFSPTDTFPPIFFFLSFTDHMLEVAPFSYILHIYMEMYLHHFKSPKTTYRLTYIVSIGTLVVQAVVGAWEWWRCSDTPILDDTGDVVTPFSSTMNTMGLITTSVSVLVMLFFLLNAKDSMKSQRKQGRLDHSMRSVNRLAIILIVFQCVNLPACLFDGPSTAKDIVLNLSNITGAVVFGFLFLDPLNPLRKHLQTRLILDETFDDLGI